MNQTDNKIVDVTIILALPVFYSLASGKAYAEALGFSIAGGLFGMLAYHIIYKLFLVKRYNFEQSTLRRYTIGCILFAAIGIPSFINQANEDRQHQKVESAITFAVGKALGICEVSKHIKAQYCSDFMSQQKMENSCLTNLTPFISTNINSRMSKLITLEEYQKKIYSSREKIDESFTRGREKGISVAELCKRLQPMSTLYKEKVDQIKTNVKKTK